MLARVDRHVSRKSARVELLLENVALIAEQLWHVPAQAARAPTPTAAIAAAGVQRGAQISHQHLRGQRPMRVRQQRIYTAIVASSELAAIGVGESATA